MTSSPRAPDLARKLVRPLLGLMLSAFVLLVLGGLFAASGLFNIGASAGHLPQVKQMLVLARSRSVSFHSRFAPDAPSDVQEAHWVQRGAAHYDDACVNCHGGPGPKVEPAAYTRALVPQPPRLAEGDLIRHRRPEELYWVVQHGLKYAGMPGWPDDERLFEAWGLAAFLQRLPDLSAQEYAELAFAADSAERNPSSFGEQELPSSLEKNVQQCSRCHGAQGVGRTSGAFPNLTLLDRGYMEASLHAYKKGHRHSGIMRSQITELTPQELSALAAHYGDQTPQVPSPPDQAQDDALLARGRRIAEEGIESRGLAPCAGCHGVEEVTETQGDDRVLAYPHLRGQYAAYLRMQLRAWRHGVRGGIRQEDPMVQGAHVLRPQEIEAVSAFYSAQEPEASDREGDPQEVQYGQR